MEVSGMPDHTRFFGRCPPSPSDGPLTMASVPSLGPSKTIRDTVIRMTDLSQTRGLLRQEPPLRRPFILQVPQNRDRRNNVGESSHALSSPTIAAGSSSDSCSSEIKQIFAKNEREPCDRCDHNEHRGAVTAASGKASRDRRGDDKKRNHRETEEDANKGHTRRHHRDHRLTPPRQPVHIEGPKTWVLMMFVLCFLVAFFTIWFGMMMAIVKRLNPNVS